MSKRRWIPITALFVVLGALGCAPITEPVASTCSFRPPTESEGCADGYPGVDPRTEVTRNESRAH
jgi:hypothetical protein